MTSKKKSIIPWDSALALYSKSNCDKCINHWLALKQIGIKLKQDSIFIGDPTNPNIEKCPECGIRFEDSNDLIGHRLDDHGAY